MTDQNLRNYLEWLITPSTDPERERFKVVVDDYIGLLNRIPDMSRQELIGEINRQLEPYDVKIDGV